MGGQLRGLPAPCVRERAGRAGTVRLAPAMNSERSWVRLAAAIIFQRDWFDFIKGFSSPLALLGTMVTLVPCPRYSGEDMTEVALMIADGADWRAACRHK